MLKTPKTLTLSIAALAFFMGLQVNNLALSDSIDTDGIKIAVVDVAKVVSNSSQVKALKKQQDQKKAELKKWLDVVKADIQKQSSEENKVKLAQKYDKELIKKQTANRTEYAKKLAEIDKSISKTIAESAKAKGVDVVFAKSAVLYGGEDLTNEISKAVK